MTVTYKMCTVCYIDYNAKLGEYEGFVSCKRK